MARRAAEYRRAAVSAARRARTATVARCDTAATRRVAAHATAAADAICDRICSTRAAKAALRIFGASQPRVLRLLELVQHHPVAATRCWAVQRLHRVLAGRHRSRVLALEADAIPALVQAARRELESAGGADAGDAAPHLPHAVAAIQSLLLVTGAQNEVTGGGAAGALEPARPTVELMVANGGVDALAVVARASRVSTALHCACVVCLRDVLQLGDRAVLDAVLETDAMQELGHALHSPETARMAISTLAATLKRFPEVPNIARKARVTGRPALRQLATFLTQVNSPEFDASLQLANSVSWFSPDLSPAQETLALTMFDNMPWRPGADPTRCLLCANLLARLALWPLDPPTWPLEPEGIADIVRALGDESPSELRAALSNMLSITGGIVTAETVTNFIDAGLLPRLIEALGDDASPSYFTAALVFRAVCYSDPPFGAELRRCAELVLQVTTKESLWRDRRADVNFSALIAFCSQEWGQECLLELVPDGERILRIVRDLVAPRVVRDTASLLLVLWGSHVVGIPYDYNSVREVEITPFVITDPAPTRRVPRLHAAAAVDVAAAVPPVLPPVPRRDRGLPGPPWAAEEDFPVMWGFLVDQCRE